MKKYPVITGGFGGSEQEQQAPYSPTEAANTLRSKATYSVLDVVSHGEVEGLVNGLSSVYLDNTSLVTADGDGFNFDGITVRGRAGEVGQSALDGISTVETPKGGTTVGLPARLLHGVRETRNISIAESESINAIRFTINVPALYARNSTGDVNGSSVSFRFYIDGVIVADKTIDGKCTKAYQKQYRFPFTPTGGVTTIAVERTSADEPEEAAEDGSQVVNDIEWISWDEITERKFEYPRTAYFSGTVDAELFGGQVPTRSYEMKGIKVLVPNGYIPPYQDADDKWVDAEYNFVGGIWDGTWNGQNGNEAGPKIKVWTSNPAWIFYDLITNTEYGAGIQDTGNKLKWALLPIAKYCDVLIDDGAGGFEPRFQVNCVINTVSSAYTLISQLSNTFMGMTWWATDSMDVSADMPQDPQILATPSNILGGGFQYSGTDRKVRHTVALVTWNDPENNYEPVLEAVEDADGIAKYGYVKTDIAPFGCTSQGQAHRAGKWLLDTEQYATETVMYSAGLDHAFVVPGMIISVADPFYVDMVSAADPSTAAQARTGGRVRSIISPVILELDQEFELLVGTYSYNLYCTMPDGTVQTRVITSHSVNSAGNTEVVLDSSLPVSPEVGAIWIITGTNRTSTREFRVISKTENRGDDGKVSYGIVALLHDKYKYVRIEQDLDLTPPDNVGDGSIGTQGGILPANNLSAVLDVYYTDGMLRNLIRVEWSTSLDERVSSYRLNYKKDSGNWVNLITTHGFLHEIFEVQEGIYTFEVVALSRTGSAESVPVQTTLAVTQSSMPNVTGLTLVNTAFDVDNNPVYNQFISGNAIFTWDRTNLRSSAPEWTPKNYSVGALVEHNSILWRATVFTNVEPLRPEHQADPFNPNTDWEMATPESAVIGEDLWFDSYLIVIDPLGINKTHERMVNNFTYTKEMNAADHNGVAVRDFTVHVYQQGTTNQISSKPASLSVSNPAPDMSTTYLDVEGAFKGLSVSWSNWVDTDTDFYSFKVYVSQDPDMTPSMTQYIVDELMKGTRTTLIAGLVADQDYYVRVMPTDEFGDGTWSSLDAGTALLLSGVEVSVELVDSITVTDSSTDNHSAASLQRLYDRDYDALAPSLRYTIVDGTEWIRYAYNIENFIDKVILITQDANARVYFRFSSDAISWTYLKAGPTHTTSDTNTLYLATGTTELEQIADAEANYLQLEYGINHAVFPQNRTAKYCEVCFVSTGTQYFTDIREVMFVREVIAEQIVADNLSAISVKTGILYSDNYDPQGASPGYMLDGNSGYADFHNISFSVTGWDQVSSNTDDLPEANATANASDTYLMDRQYHVGGMDYADVVNGPPIDATLNYPDSYLLDRSKHQGTQEYGTLLNAPPADAHLTSVWSRVEGAPKIFRVVALGTNAAGYATIPGISDSDNLLLTTAVSPTWNLSVFDRGTEEWDAGWHRSYNLVTTPARAIDLANDLNSLSSDKLIVLFTHDNPEPNRLDPALVSAVYNCGGSSSLYGSTKFLTGGAYILVGIPGIGAGRGFELYAGNTINAEESWLDTIFTVQNGNIQLTGITTQNAVDISYADGTTLEDLKPAHAGATAGAVWDSYDAEGNLIQAGNVQGGPEALSAAGALLEAQLQAYRDVVTAELLIQQGQIGDIRGIADGAISSWFLDGTPDTTVEPELSWVTLDITNGNDAEKLRHVGDLYYDRTNGRAYRYIYTNSIFSWYTILDSEVTQALQLADGAYVLADNKKTVFVAEPLYTQSYDEGDLYRKDGALYTCITPKAKNVLFNLSHWALVADTTGLNIAANTLMVGTTDAQVVADNAVAALTAVDSMSSDLVFSVPEKLQWRISYSGLLANYDAIYAQAVTFGVYTNADIVTLTNKKNALYNFLNSTHAIWALNPVDSALPDDTFRTVVSGYYTAESNAVSYLGNYTTYNSIQGEKPPTNADQTSSNTALNINGQGSLATLSSVVYGTQVVGGPPTNSDNTSDKLNTGVTMTSGWLDVNGQAGINGLNTSGNDVRFWAGSNYAGRNNAPFRVLQSGKVLIKSASSGERMEISEERIDVYDINGIRRVRLGKL